MLNKLDFLGPSVSLFHKGDGRITSMLGGILTLLAMLFFVFMFGFFSLDIFLKEEPRISFSVNLEDKNELEVKELGLALLIMPLIQNSFIATKNRRIKAVGLHYIATQDSPELDITPFEMVNCAETALFKENKLNILANLVAPPELYYCIPDSFSAKLKGARTKGESHILSLELQVCTDNGCFDSNDTMKQLDTYYFQLLAIENYVDSFSFTQPLKTSFMAFSARSFSAFSQNFEFYLRHVDVISDDGWIFTNDTSERGFRFAERNFSTGPVGKSTGLLRFNFIFDDKKEVYRRAYIKLPEIVANTGGIMKATLMVFSFILKQLNWHKFYENELIRLKSAMQKGQFDFSSNNNSTSSNKIVMPKPVYRPLKAFSRTFKSFFFCSKENQMIRKYERFFKKIMSEEIIREIIIEFTATKKSEPNFTKRIQKAELELIYEGKVSPQISINSYIEQN